MFALACIAHAHREMRSSVCFANSFGSSLLFTVTVGPPTREVAKADRGKREQWGEAEREVWHSLASQMSAQWDKKVKFKPVQGYKSTNFKG